MKKKKILLSSLKKLNNNYTVRNLSMVQNKVVQNSYTHFWALIWYNYITPINQSVKYLNV